MYLIPCINCGKINELDWDGDPDEYRNYRKMAFCSERCAVEDYVKVVRERSEERNSGDNEIDKIMKKLIEKYCKLLLDES